MDPCREYFSRNLLTGSRKSAEEILPFLLRVLRPRSVVDVGCGTGGWLAVLRGLGVDDVLGVDGPWADRKKLEIPKGRFRVFDLKKPLRLGRRFDLVLSLEVAQHLPERYAAAFVSSLTGLGPAVLFSAAIPFQGGIGHVNEQWPEYWVEHFGREGYVPIDCVRKRVWGNPHVEWWFAQNTLLFAEKGYVERRPLFKREFEATCAGQLALVHPRPYVRLAGAAERLRRAAAEVAALVPPGETLILVGGAELENMVAAGRRALPFLERDGQPWGNPPDDRTAIRELERMRRAGAGFLVFAWPAFWWLDCYADFHRHLRERFRCVLENDRVVIFDLRAKAGSNGKAAGKRSGRVATKARPGHAKVGKGR